MAFEGPFHSRIIGFPSLHKTGAQASSLLFINYMKEIELAPGLANLEEMMLKGKHIWVHGTLYGDFLLSLRPWSFPHWKCGKLYCVKRQKILMLRMSVNSLNVAKPSGHGIVKFCLFTVQPNKGLVFLDSWFCLDNESGKSFIPTYFLGLLSQISHGHWKSYSSQKSRCYILWPSDQSRWFWLTEHL